MKGGAYDMIHWENFLAFEEENGLFDLKEDGVYIWDILRFHVYIDYMWENFREQTARKSLGVKLRLSLRRIWLLFTFLFKKTKPNIFLTFSRDRTEDGQYYDKNANDFLQRLYTESHVIETYQVDVRKYVYPVALFKPSSLFNGLYYWLHGRRDYSALVEKINKGLNLDWDNRMVNRHICYFKCERWIYRWLFRIKRPRRVWVTQNGLQKGLFCAAREYQVETVEFQHGIIDKGHIAYNYPAAIQTDSRIYIADMLMTFSGFWAQDVNFPIKQIIPAGNTVFASVNAYRQPFNPKSRTVGFVSADVFGPLLMGLAKEYAELNPADDVIFKLHPNEFPHQRKFEDLFRNYPNIRVVTNEYPTEEVIQSCHAIVLIQSTIAYQALQAGIPVFIYKRMTYYRHAHIFGSPNVTLIENARQIAVTGSARHSEDIFFERFDESVYHRLSNLTE
jgi:hypothetical protein